MPLVIGAKPAQQLDHRFIIEIIESLVDRRDHLGIMLNQPVELGEVARIDILHGVTGCSIGASAGWP
ncbi:MAG: hypothetical protein AB7P03_15375 [Kofleriaceae bacterium]